MGETIFDNNRMIEIEISDGSGYSLSRLTFDLLEDQLKGMNDYLRAWKVDSVEDCINLAKSYATGTGAFSEDAEDEDVLLSKRTFKIKEIDFPTPWVAEKVPSADKDIVEKVRAMTEFLDDLDEEITSDVSAADRIVTKVLDYYTSREGDPIVTELLDNKLSYDNTDYSDQYFGRTPLSFVCDVLKIQYIINDLECLI